MAVSGTKIFPKIPDELISVRMVFQDAKGKRALRPDGTQKAHPLPLKGTFDHGNFPDRSPPTCPTHRDIHA